VRQKPNPQTQKETAPESETYLFFLAVAHPDLQALRPLYTCLPKTLIKNGELDEENYINSRWASINCAANCQSPNTFMAIGSHLLPDLKKPLQKKEIPKEFLKSLEAYSAKSLGKSSPTRSPGLQNPKKSQKNPNNPQKDGPFPL
jgi:hypothetical protein